MTLVVRDKAQLKKVLDAIIDGIGESLAAKRASGFQVMPPEDLEITGIMLDAYDDGEDLQVTTSDAHEVTTSDTTPAHSIVTTTAAPVQTTTTTETPPNRTTTRTTNGGDRTIIDRVYKQEDEI